MKTAMQELIIDLIFNLEHEIGVRLNTKRFAPFLEKEKEQIIDAYNQGTLDGESSMLDYPNYFDQTYNQNK